MRGVELEGHGTEILAVVEEQEEAWNPEPEVMDCTPVVTHLTPALVGECLVDTGIVGRAEVMESADRPVVGTAGAAQSERGEGLPVVEWGVEDVDMSAEGRRWKKGGIVDDTGIAGLAVG